MLKQLSDATKIREYDIILRKQWEELDYFLNGVNSMILQGCNCILKYEGNGENIKKRMKVMCETNDGFKISEKDLELRGSGDFFGTMQHGLPEFKIANLFEDMPILQQVQQVAQSILLNDAKLEKEENKELAYIVNKKLEGLGNGTL